MLDTAHFDENVYMICKHIGRTDDWAMRQLTGLFCRCYESLCTRTGLTKHVIPFPELPSWLRGAENQGRNPKGCPRAVMCPAQLRLMAIQTVRWPRSAQLCPRIRRPRFDMMTLPVMLPMMPRFNKIEVEGL